MEILDMRVLEMSDVERDVAGLPKAWPILRAGDNVVTRRQAMPINLRLTREDLQGMVEYHQAKGVKIPLDCQHVVSNLAGKVGLDEAELLRRLPRYSGVAGFGKLELRGEALYLAEVEYLPIGREVMAAGQFRYFSPALRGLDGKSPLRCTSVALTNEPCLNGLVSLAAAEDGESDENVTPEMVLEAQNQVKQEKEVLMSDEKKTAGAAAGTPTLLAVAREVLGDGVTEENLRSMLAALKTKADSLELAEKGKTADGGEAARTLAVAREVLGDGVTAENLRSQLAALKTKADSGMELAEKVKKLECAEETRALDTVRKDALSKGKLTQAMLERPYFKKMTSVELSEYCQAVDDGVAVPVGVLELGEKRERVNEKKAESEPMTVSDAIAAAPVHEMK